MSGEGRGDDPSLRFLGLQVFAAEENPKERKKEPPKKGGEWRVQNRWVKPPGNETSFLLAGSILGGGGWTLSCTHLIVGGLDMITIRHQSRRRGRGGGRRSQRAGSEGTKEEREGSFGSAKIWYFRYVFPLMGKLMVFSGAKAAKKMCEFFASEKKQSLRKMINPDKFRGGDGSNP